MQETCPLKIYAAAIYTSNLGLHGSMFNRLNPREREARLGVRRILESYHYVHKQSAVDKMRRDGTRIFLDSGAFSAHMLGTTIDLADYCAYIKRNQDIIDVYSVLDGIGDPVQTGINQDKMEQQGLSPIPCFHYGEPEEFLEHYIANYAYISLGGMVMQSRPQLILWLDRLWAKYLTNRDGTPKVKVHGFGLTKLDIMYRYPWYSVDSTAWQQCGSCGLLILPPDGKRFAVSNASPSRRHWGQHADTVPELEKKALTNRVESRGFDWNRIQETYLARWTFNLAAFEEITLHFESLTGSKFINPQPTLF